MADKDIKQNCRYHKWIVFASAIVISWMNFGFIFPFGALFLAILEQYDGPRSSAATVHSVLMGVTLSFGVVSGLLVSRFGHWKVAMVGSFLLPAGFIISFFARSIIELDIYIGVISGIGISMTFISNVAALGQVFSGTKRFLALSIQNSAISLSSLTYPYIFEWLLDQYALSGTFLILGGIFLNSFLSVYVLYGVEHKTNMKGNNSEDDNGKKGIDNKMLDVEDMVQISAISRSDGSECITESCANDQTTVANDTETDAKRLYGVFSFPYIFLNLGIGLSIASVNGFSAVVLDIFKWKGFTIKEGLLSFLPFSILSFVARILPGILKQKRGVNSVFITLLFSLAGATGQLIILLSNSLIAVMFGVGLSGASPGGCISSGSLAVLNVVGLSKFPVAYGLTLTTIGLTSSVTGPVYGAIRDETGSYQMVLILATVLLMVGTLFLFACLVVRYTRRDRVARKRTTVSNSSLSDVQRN